MRIIESRIERLRRIIRRKKINALLVTNIRNVRYLTGFTGSSAFALITATKALFFTDFRYTEQAGYEVTHFERVTEKGNRVRLIRNLVKEMAIGRLGFEASASYYFYEELHKAGISLAPQSGLVEKMRMIKDSVEVEKIMEAIRRAEDAFIAVKPAIRPGVAERAIGLRLESELKKRGCARAAFDIIIASGRHSSMPHAGQTEKKIERGDFVIIDWGGEADGYYSDMTRTVLMAGPEMSRKKRIYDIVNTAREKAIREAQAGMKSSEVDRAARQHISAAGYGEFFGHGTGHGIGLDVHENPRISWAGRETLADGMVFSVEPGIYVPGFGGVRIEDLVLMQGGKARTLTQLNRKLEIINGLYPNKGGRI